MALMHHVGLRVNAAAVDDPDAMDVYGDAGWVPGPHPDTDLDDPLYPPAVLPAQPSAAKTGKTPKE